MNRDREEARIEGGRVRQPANWQFHRVRISSIFVCIFGGRRRGETVLLKLCTGVAYKSIYAAKTNKAAPPAA